MFSKITVYNAGMATMFCWWLFITASATYTLAVNVKRSQTMHIENYRVSFHFFIWAVVVGSASFLSLKSFYASRIIASGLIKASKDAASKNEIKSVINAKGIYDASALLLFVMIFILVIEGGAIEGVYAFTYLFGSVMIQLITNTIALVNLCENSNFASKK